MIKRVARANVTRDMGFSKKMENFPSDITRD
jgi:hypothetical protein